MQTLTSTTGPTSWRKNTDMLNLSYEYVCSCRYLKTYQSEYSIKIMYKHDGRQDAVKNMRMRLKNKSTSGTENPVGLFFCFAAF